MFYSKSTHGFYTPEIHGDKIPTDAVEITDSHYEALLAGQSNDKVISADADGNPILIDPPAQTAEQLAVFARQKRDGLLAASDWTIVNDSPLSPEIQTEWKMYRQALRDITSQSGFPDVIVWPVAPA